MAESLKYIIHNKKLLKKFRVFLRGHLALENLLFFESIELYEASSREKRVEAGKFMINQFVREDSEDATNLSYRTREALEELEEYEEDSFSQAKREMYTLLDTNFIQKFNLYLDGEGDPLITEFSPFMSRSYFTNLSYDSLDQLLKEDGNGGLEFINCSCESSSGHAFCCEVGRRRMKLHKILGKMKECRERKARSIRWVKSTAANISKRYFQLRGIKRKLRSTQSLGSYHYEYNQPDTIHGYACWQC